MHPLAAAGSGHRWRPFLLLPGAGVFFVGGWGGFFFFFFSKPPPPLPKNSSKRASKIFQHHPERRRPALPQVLVRVIVPNSWGTSEQLLLEVAPAIRPLLARVRQGAPSGSVILRSLWGKGRSGWSRCFKAGLTSSADGLLLPLPRKPAGGKGY